MIDAPMLVFRAFHGIAEPLHDSAGRPVHAVLGFCRSLLDLLRHSGGPAAVLCWDESLGSGFRHRLYPPYKAQRPLADEDFLYQLQCCAALASALGVPQLASQEFEADDLIASVVWYQRQAGQGSLVVSQDKDLAQVIAGDDRLWAFPKAEPLDAAALEARWQMPLACLADYQALCGDAVDNIPGVRGVGAVTARHLITRFGSLEGLYAGLDEVAGMPLRGARTLGQKLADQHEEAFLFRELTRLRNDALSQEQWQALQSQTADLSALKAVLQQCGLWPRLAGRVTRFFEAGQETR